MYMDISKVQLDIIIADMAYDRIDEDEKEKDRLLWEIIGICNMYGEFVAEGERQRKEDECRWKSVESVESVEHRVDADTTPITSEKYVAHLHNTDGE